MSEYRCEYVMEWEVVEEGDQGYSRPLEYCDKIAHFKDDLGHWWCADHWDAKEAAREFYNKEFGDTDDGFDGWESEADWDETLYIGVDIGFSTDETFVALCAEKDGNLFLLDSIKVSESKKTKFGVL